MHVPLLTVAQPQTAVCLPQLDSVNELNATVHGGVSDTQPPLIIGVSTLPFAEQV
jgi:hypothetical protein